jgi:long-chain fatty acid transport protein
LSKLGRIQAGILRGGMALLLLGTFDSAFAGGYDVNAIGHRARAMGGAFTGLADDWSAAYYNPAGCAFLGSSEFYLGAAAMTPRIDFVPDLALNGWDVNNMAPGTYGNVDITAIVPQVGGYAKLPDAWGTNIGLAFYSPIDNDMIWNLYNPFYLIDSAFGQRFPAPDTESDINVWTGQPTIGMQVLKNKVSLGLGLVVNYANLYQHRVQLVDDPGQKFNFPSLPGGKAFTDGIVEGNGWGIGYNLGMLAKLSQWSIGASFQSKVVHSMTGTSSNNFWTQSVGSRGTTLLERDLLNGVVWNAIQDIDFELTTPPRLTLGFAYEASKNLRFVGDLAYTWYAHVPGIIITTNDQVEFSFGDAGDSSFVTLSNSETFDWEDQYRLAVGTEWDASAGLQLRAGYSFEPSMIANAGLTPLQPHVGGKHSPSVGASIKVGRYQFSGTYGLVAYENNTVATATDNNLPGSYSGVQHDVFLSLSYRW